MGYGSYSAAAHAAITQARAGASASSVFQRNDCDPKMNPRGVRFRESRDSADHPDSVGIVLALDVSGSMGEIPHQLATKTLPTFMTSVRTILKGPQILFMAFGNAYADKSPLQVGQFESEAALIDRWLAATHLEGGGGALGESYDLAMFFAARHTAMDCWEKRQKKGYFFMTGDETPWMELIRDHVSGLIGDALQSDIPIHDVVREVQEKFHTFFLIPDAKRAATELCGAVWSTLLRERCIVLETPEDTAAIAALCVGIEEGALKDDAAITTQIEQGLKEIGASRDRLLRTITPFAMAHRAGTIAGPGALYRPHRHTERARVGRVLFTTGPDPRFAFAVLSAPATLTEAQQRELAALPLGARQVPLEWVCETKIEQSGHFDRDRQEDVYTERSIVSGWRAALDPRVERATQLSFYGQEQLATGLFATMPAALAPSITALVVEGHQLFPTALATIGANRAWTDLQIWGARWAPVSRKANLRELAASFPSLRGLEMRSAWLEPDDLLRALASASFVPELDDLVLTDASLEASASQALFAQLGALRDLDLRDSRLGRHAAIVLAPKLVHARHVGFSGNAIGDAGIDALAAAGVLANVVHLRIARCGLTDRSLDTMIAADMPALRSLYVEGNAFTDDALARLVGAPLFARLESASLGSDPAPQTDALLVGHPLAESRLHTTSLPGVTSLWFMGRAT